MRYAQFLADHLPASAVYPYRGVRERANSNRTTSIITTPTITKMPSAHLAFLLYRRRRLGDPRPISHSNPKNLRHHEGRSTGRSGVGGAWVPGNSSVAVSGDCRGFEVESLAGS